MLITFDCTSCRTSQQAEARLAGRTLRCYHCSGLFVVPDASVPALPEPEAAADIDLGLALASGEMPTATGDPLTASGGPDDDIDLTAPPAEGEPAFAYDAAAAAYDFSHPSGTDPLLAELGLLDESLPA